MTAQNYKPLNPVVAVWQYPKSPAAPKEGVDAAIAELTEAVRELRALVKELSRRLDKGGE